MDEIGSILRDARETKSLSLAEVHERLRINERFLQALEEGEYGLLPTPIHLRGFLRNYARFLDLDPDPLVERLEAWQAKQPQAPALNGANGDQRSQFVPQMEEQPFFNPVNMELDDSFGVEKTESGLRLVIIAALIIAIGLVANRFVPLVTGNGDGTEAIQQAIIELMNRQEGAAEEDEAGVETMNSSPFLTTSALTTTLPVTSTSRNGGVVSPAATGPTPTRPPLPATMEQIGLRLDVTERTWIKVTIDGEVVFQDLVTKGDGPFEWEALQEARLLTGNAAGVYVTINGVELGKLGERAEVVEEVWQATGQ